MMITASDSTAGLKIIPSDTINIPGPRSKYNGISTAVAAFKLTDASSIQGGFVQVLDANGNITNQGVQIGDVVYNSSTARSAIAYVTAIDSATSLTLSANIFPVTANLDGYNIYSGNGVDLNSEEGFRLPKQNIYATLPFNQPNPVYTTNTMAGYGQGTPSIPLASIGGTYTGSITAVNVQTKADGTLLQILIDTDGVFTNSNIVGQTIIFSQATLRTAFGVDGTGEAIITIDAAMVEFTTPSPDQRNAKAFQVYCGGTTAEPIAASCDIYVTTIDGDDVFFEDVQPGTILPVVVSKVNIGSAAGAGNGNNNTLTTATGRYVALN